MIPPYRLDQGRYVAVDLDTLVHDIYVSPFAGEWFQDLLRDVIARLRPGMEKRLVRSSIRDM